MQRERGMGHHLPPTMFWSLSIAILCLSFLYVRKLRAVIMLNSPNSIEKTTLDSWRVAKNFSLLGIRWKRRLALLLIDFKKLYPFIDRLWFCGHSVSSKIPISCSMYIFCFKHLFFSDLCIMHTCCLLEVLFIVLSIFFFFFFFKKCRRSEKIPPINWSEKEWMHKYMDEQEERKWRECFTENAANGSNTW